MNISSYHPAPGERIRCFNRSTQDGHGGRAEEHRKEMRQIAESAIKELVPDMAMQIYADTVQDMLNALEYDIETIVSISFDDAQDIFTSNKARKYVSDMIMREIINHLKSTKFPGVTIK